MGLPYGILLVVVTLAIPIIYGVVVYPEFGIIIIMIAAYFIMLVIKFDINFPLGTIMDALEVLLLLGLFIRQKKKSKDWSVLKTPVTAVVLIWIGYNLLQAINPVAESIMAWLYTVRSIVLVTILYFVFMVNIDTKKFIRIIIAVWLVLSVIAALYGLKQQTLGFSSFELRSMQDPLVMALLFIDGRWRIFSIFNDPVVFSYNMVISTLLCVALAWGPTSWPKKIILMLMAFLFVYVMLFSGTRGAYVMLPASMLLFFVMIFKRKMLPLAILGAIFFVILINIPTNNATLWRFQTAFKPSDDASFNVRKSNQKRIQPYILTHPIGGGLGATGAWGVRFAPDSYLAKFPPDSGYMRVAVELGWIGLLIYCIYMFVILKTGISNFFSIKDPELKSYCFGMLLIIFALNIGNFPQEALVQYPTNIFFYLVVALLIVTKKIDTQLQEKNKVLPVAAAQ